MSALVPILPDRDRRRLVSVAALLESDRDGEVLGALMAARRLLKPHNLTVAQLFEVALTPQAAPWPETRRPDPVRAGDHRHIARTCLAAGAGINSSECSFLDSITRWDGSLTPKQRAALEAIEAKIERVRS